MRSSGYTFLAAYLLLALTGAVCSGLDEIGVDLDIDLYPLSGTTKGGLEMDFYKKSCPDVDDIVRNITWRRSADNSTLIAKLVRLHYHDCFVRGCDASILLDPIYEDDVVEKQARPNQGIEGYDVIDEIKAKLEQVCPETVSCADIVALAAREAVTFQMKQPKWKVATGRRDGRVSLGSEADRDLPKGGSNFTTLYDQFVSLGLDVMDLVALSGAHTVGEAHCFIISRRLFNFFGNGTGTDPSLDPAYADYLKTKCSPNPSNTLEMDPDSSLTFDNHYYVALAQNKGLFQSDAALLTDSRAAEIVYDFLKKPNAFSKHFSKSMMNMGDLGVLTGHQGEIRKSCRYVN